MKKIVLATAVAAFILPNFALAQNADTGTASGTAATSGTEEPQDMTGATGSSQGTTGAGAGDAAANSTEAPSAGDAMSGDAMSTDTTASTTADTTGNYTIVTRTAAESNGMNNGTDVNTNTDAASVQSTIDANPGLAEALTANGIEMDDIGSISVEPNGQVVVFSKS